MRKIRDPVLLEAVDQISRESLNRSAFRVVRNGRDPLEPSRNANRWDLGHFNVLYTSLVADGAIAEIDFHLSRQPVFPSLYRPTLYELKVDLERVARLDTIEALERLEVKRDTYPSTSYGRTREIGDAVAFLGFDGLLVPNARWPCINLVVFTDDIPPDAVSIVAEKGIIDLQEWRTSARNRKLRKALRAPRGKPNT